MTCVGCEYKKKAPEGICKTKNAWDGLPIRRVGICIKDKSFYPTCFKVSDAWP